MPTPASAPAVSTPRLESVDLLRGIVMVVMALDHVRDFVHFPALHGTDPTDLTQTSPWIFLTRFITHYCAPTFSFLAGTGVYLAATRGKTKAELSRFLFTRGLWLIFLELTFFNWAWQFDYSLHSNWGLVIWALGWSMIILAGLVHLPLKAVAVLSVLLIVGHNALDGIRPESLGAAGGLWQLLHVPGNLRVGEHFQFWVMYPLIPWVAVMSAGYCFGALYQLDAAVRRRWLWRLGLGALASFVILRSGNFYGDAAPWSAQPRGPLFSALSFLNVTKYPPSLLYLLVTLGPGFLLLAAWDRGIPGWLRPLLTFGRVPFFYYCLHLPLIHGLAWLYFKHRYGRVDWTIDNPANAPADAGLSLLQVYGVWLAVILLLYPLCRWFADYKRRHRDQVWLTYF